MSDQAGEQRIVINFKRLFAALRGPIEPCLENERSKKIARVTKIWRYIIFPLTCAVDHVTYKSPSQSINLFNILQSRNEIFSHAASLDTYYLCS
jgi:hypothetical protein